jgi:hypothetical protein
MLCLESVLSGWAVTGVNSGMNGICFAPARVCATSRMSGFILVLGIGSGKAVYCMCPNAGERRVYEQTC